ncbi:MAG: hypothetical protein ACR2FF_07350 [Mycobacteriales bacterium]|nr:MAG: hypothetical protein DLM56_03040 [Pseudonocardiales bacterium]
MLVSCASIGLAAVPGGGLVAVGYSSDANGTVHPIAMRLQGSTWHLQWAATPSGGGAFTSVVAVSPTDIWAVGGVAYPKSLIEHFDGTRWWVVVGPPCGAAEAQNLDAVTAVSATRRRGGRCLSRSDGRANDDAAALEWVTLEQGLTIDRGAGVRIARPRHRDQQTNTLVAPNRTAAAPTRWWPAFQREATTPLPGRLS